MNTAQLKVISWSLAALFGAGLAGYVGDYLMHRDGREKRVSQDEIKEFLSKVAPVEKKAEDIVTYKRVNEALYRYNWTGKPPPKIKEPEGPKVPTKLGPDPVSTLVKVLLIKEDPTDDSGSRVVLKYLPPANVTLKEQTVVKHVGNTLDAPQDHITVAAILADGVSFKFKDPARKEELLLPDEFKNRLDMHSLATGSSVPQPTEVRFPRTKTFGEAPARTVLLGDGQYQIGTEDMSDWEMRYDEYLAEVELDRHRDPSTGKYDGIALTDVPAGSVAAAHGAKQGDVIKSINGHAVNSTQEALSFVKNNKDKYDVWEVEIDRKGKIVMLTYKVPKKK